MQGLRQQPLVARMNSLQFPREMISRFLGFGRKRESESSRTGAERVPTATVSYQQVSYSQSAEDIIAGRVLGRLNCRPVRYLDVGANYPKKLNNTWKFYQNGGSGVLVEPNPALCKEIARVRPRDTVLNVGVASVGEGLADYYVMSNAFLSTFDKQVAENAAASGQARIERVDKIPLTTLNQITTAHFPEGLHFLSLDVEGLDFELLKTFNFSACMPEVVCVETIEFIRGEVERKCTDVIAFMEDVGYMVYADTYINTIFVDREKWLNRWGGVAS